MTINKQFFYKTACLISYCLMLQFSAVLYAESSESQVTHLSQQQFIDKLATENNTVIIDVRTAKEFAKGHIPGAINIPHKTILADHTVLQNYASNDKVFYCHSGFRAGKVTDLLTRENHKGLYHLKGDFRAWQGNGRAIER